MKLASKPHERGAKLPIIYVFLYYSLHPIFFFSGGRAVWYDRYAFFLVVLCTYNVV